MVIGLMKKKHIPESSDLAPGTSFLSDMKLSRPPPPSTWFTLCWQWSKLVWYAGRWARSLPIMRSLSLVVCREGWGLEVLNCFEGLGCEGWLCEGWVCEGWDCEGCVCEGWDCEGWDCEGWGCEVWGWEFVWGTEEEDEVLVDSSLARHNHSM